MINGTILRKAIISGANNILNAKTSVDELNIFPVPDGDTGTNMSMTMSAGVKELQKTESPNACEIAQTAASALLRGARGNSGVILSLLFRGFAKGLSGKNEVTGMDLACALEIGVSAAYKAVMKPTEGTILTVSRVAAECGKAAAEANDDPLFVWQAICDGAEDALSETPELLPVLKKAGVVDAGGKGLCLIFDGMMSVFRDGVMIVASESNDKNEVSTDAFRNAAAEFDQDIRFTYCTEFIVGRDREISTDPGELRSYLETIGDCVVVVDDDEIIKVHVHTESPGTALQKGLEFGQLLTVKVENMKEQHRLAAEANEKAKAQTAKPVVTRPDPVEPTEEIGFVAVAAGDGLQSLFHDLGCIQVVSGGQTMNPSTEDIAAAIMATPAKQVFVLPNNKNIIMAAEQTVPLITDRSVIVLPTRTIPQGLSAMLAFDPDASAEENENAMKEAMAKVSTGQVTFAARNSEYGGKKIREGDILGLVDGKLELIDKDPVHAVLKVTRSMLNRSTSFITLIYGEDTTEAQAQEAFERIKSKVSDDIEVTLVQGGQPVYYFIVSVE